MKKLLSYFNITALAVLAVLSSCSKDEDDPKPAPSVSALAKGGYTTADATVPASSTVKVAWTANKGDANLKTFTVTQDGNNLGAYNGGVPKSISGSTYQDSISFTAPASGSATYKFTATDNDGQSGSFSIKITVGAATSALEESTVILLGNQSNNDEGSFYSTSEDEVYTQAEAIAASGKVDFVHYYGTTNQATIAAPNDTQAGTIFKTGLDAFTTKNATLFNTSLVAADYAAITKDNIAAKVGTPSQTAATKLAVGSVVGFKTAAGKLGVFKVTQVSGTYTESGTVTIDVKVQQ